MVVGWTFCGLIVAAITFNSNSVSLYHLLPRIDAIFLTGSSSGSIHHPVPPLFTGGKKRRAAGRVMPLHDAMLNACLLLQRTRIVSCKLFRCFFYHTAYLRENYRLTAVHRAVAVMYAGV